MALFNFGKKKEEKEQTCSCQCGCSSENEAKVNTNCCGEANVKSIWCIKVLGAGCKSCHEQYENVKQAVAELNLTLEVEYITDMEKVMSFGVMSMPAIVINDNIVSMGKVLKTADVIKLIQKVRKGA